MEVGCFTPAEKSSYAFTNSYEKKSFKWIYSWVREWGWKQFLGKSKILAKDPEEDYYYSIPLYELH